MSVLEQFQLLTILPDELFGCPLRRPGDWFGIFAVYTCYPS